MGTNLFCRLFNSVASCAVLAALAIIAPVAAANNAAASTQRIFEVAPRPRFPVTALLIDPDVSRNSRPPAARSFEARGSATAPSHRFAISSAADGA